MRVLITGGTGLIGTAAARELAAAGHEVIVLSRRPERVSSLPPGVRAEPWDGAGGAAWEELLDRESAVLHLAGESIAGGRWTAERKRRIRDSRVASGPGIVAAVRRARVRPSVLLQGSAVGWYGPCGYEEVGEDHPPGNDFLARVCAAWEDSTAEVEALGVRRAVLRTGVILAREGGALPKLLRPFRLGLGGRLGDGRQGVPWIHIADQAGAIRFLLETAGALGAFNLAAPQPVDNRELTRALGAAVHRPTLFVVPRPALSLALGEMAGMVLHGQRAVPRRLLAAGYRFRFPELGPALADLTRRRES